MKKVDFKKTIVRNAIQPIPKPNLLKDKPKTEKIRTNGLPMKTVDEDPCKLDKPELQSTLKLEKRIDDLVKYNQTKTLTSEKLAVDEKLTRKVNFPYDQPIYKDLIPLDVDQCKSSQVISSRGPLPHKDKEPVLTDFLEVKTSAKYFCLPQVKIENKFDTIGNNNLRVYHILEKYSDFNK